MFSKKITSNIILAVILLAILVVFCSAFAARACNTESENVSVVDTGQTDEARTAIAAATTPSLQPTAIKFVDTTDISELVALVEECDKVMAAAHEMAESARSLGYEEESYVIQLAKEEYKQALKFKEEYNEVLIAQEDLLYSSKMEEFPVATTIWKYFKELGYNDYVIAGLIGNMMCETGGQTLNIQYEIYGQSYYGICQWNSGYKSLIWGKDLQAQLDFLRDTIKEELDTFGFCYKDGFGFEEFLELQNAEDAALAFAKCYERCAKWTYSPREKCALIAYNYFVQ